MPNRNPYTAVTAQSPILGMVHDADFHIRAPSSDNQCSIVGQRRLHCRSINASLSLSQPLRCPFPAPAAPLSSPWIGQFQGLESATPGAGTATMAYSLPCDAIYIGCEWLIEAWSSHALLSHDGLTGSMIELLEALYNKTVISRFACGASVVD